MKVTLEASKGKKKSFPKTEQYKRTQIVKVSEGKLPL